MGSVKPEVSRHSTFGGLVERAKFFHQRRLPFCWLLFSFGAVCMAQHASTAPIPVGLDAYRAWDRWDEQKIGMRAHMRSTYDRTGGNEGADASHLLYQLKERGAKSNTRFTAL
jgi:hypothetical protein